MDRQYLKEDKVNIYDTMRGHNNGELPLRQVLAKPYSYAGCDYYRVNDKIRPGYRDHNDASADACVYLNGPGSWV